MSQHGSPSCPSLRPRWHTNCHLVINITTAKACARSNAQNWRLEYSEQAASHGCRCPLIMLGVWCQINAMAIQLSYLQTRSINFGWKDKCKQRCIAAFNSIAHLCHKAKTDSMGKLKWSRMNLRPWFTANRPLPLSVQRCCSNRKSSAQFLAMSLSTCSVNWWYWPCSLWNTKHRPSVSCPADSVSIWQVWKDSSVEFSAWILLFLTPLPPTHTHSLSTYCDTCCNEEKLLITMKNVLKFLVKKIKSILSK